MKIIVMGTGPFAVPTLRWLVDSPHEICLVVTRPIEDAGKRRKSVANPVREFAASLESVEIFAPKNVNEKEAIEKLSAHAADLLFVCDYGQILKNETLATARLGGINLHGSLLPQYRGAAPINWAIFNGDRETGVTVIHMTPRLDGGPILATRILEILENETAEQLEPRMAESGVQAVADSIHALQQWDGQSPIGQTQDPDLVTQAPRLKKQQGNLDFARSALQLSCQIRAFQPWPGSFTNWLPENGKPVRLIVHSVDVEESTSEAPTGTVTGVDDRGISIATTQGQLILREVQPAGKKKMPVADFLRGRNVAVGDRFGSAVPEPVQRTKKPR